MRKFKTHYKNDIQPLNAYDLEILRSANQSPPAIFYIIFSLILTIGVVVTLAGISSPEHVIALMSGVVWTGMVLLMFRFAMRALKRGEKDLADGRKRVISSMITSKSRSAPNKYPPSWHIYFGSEQHWVSQSDWDSLEIEDCIEIHKSMHANLTLSVRKIDSFEEKPDRN
jgi:hypothetical protein